MKIIKYTEARLNLRRVLDQVADSGNPTCVISKNNQVVIIPKDIYDMVSLMISTLNSPTGNEIDKLEVK